MKSKIIRASVFYANPRKVRHYRLNHFLKVFPPQEDELQAMKINTAAVLESMQACPFDRQRPAEGCFEYVKMLTASGKYRGYLNRKLGVERGICLLMGFGKSASAASAPPSIASSGSEGSGGGDVLAPQNPAPGLVSPLADTFPSTAAHEDAGTAVGLATAVAPAIEAETEYKEDVIHEAGAPELETVTVFGGTPKQSPGQDILLMVVAAMPVIETVAERNILFDFEQGGLNC